MHEYLFVLRLVHIALGIFWAGSVMLMAWFIMPAARKAGPEGGKMIAAITGTNHFPIVLNVSALLSVIAGCLLIWELSGGLQSGWMGSKMGICFSTGGILAIIALFLGTFVNRPTIMKLNKMRGEIAQSGNPPSDVQKATLERLGKRMYMATQMLAGLLALCVILMSVARYA
jgi:uncharacterized membrane protein